jgi:uncharacterized protein YodC (DUF2158 family)
MKFKPGDVVIKTTGGNKMIVYSPINDSYECIWVSDKMYKDIFSENEIVSLEEYKDKYIKTEAREDKINQILNQLPS